MQSLRISTAPAEQNAALIHHFLANESGWADRIPYETVVKSIENSLCFGGFLGSEQVAFARVVSDYATFAYLVDVFVLPEHRGCGYSAVLVSAVLAHSQLQGLRRFMLATSTAHGLSEKFGFAAPGKPHTLMEKFLPNAYRNAA